MGNTSRICLVSLVCFAATSCQQGGTTTINKSASAASVKSVVPKPPKNQLAGRGFGLEETVDESQAVPQTSANGKTEAPGQGTGEGYPSDAISAQGGGYWSKSSSSGGPSGYAQYFDTSGKATNWYGQPGTGSSANTFSMIQGNNTSQVFLAQKSADGWNSGKIVDANGKPYVFTDQYAAGGGSNSIVSNGYTVNADGTANFNWLAQSGGISKAFQTNGFDLNKGAQAGMTYYYPIPNGDIGRLQPQTYNPNTSWVNGSPTNAEGGQTPFMTLFSAIMGN